MPCVVEEEIENERAWKVKVGGYSKVRPRRKPCLCKSRIKNPRAKEDFEHLPPEKLVDDILEKELRIGKLMTEVKQVLG